MFLYFPCRWITLFFNHLPFFPVVAYLIDRGRFPGGVYFRVLSSFSPSSLLSSTAESPGFDLNRNANRANENAKGGRLVLEAAGIPFTALFYQYRSTMRVIAKQYTLGRIAHSLFLGNPLPYQGKELQEQALEAWQVVEIPSRKQVGEIGQQWMGWVVEGKRKIPALSSTDNAAEKSRR